MARRNIFAPPPPPAEANPFPDMAEDKARSRFPNTAVVAGMKTTLKNFVSTSIQEIDPALVDDGGPKDRIGITEEDVRELAESIRTHGQQVPIMVRPSPEEPGRYQIVYGRRRLKALKLIGSPAKAMIRNLSEQQAILAQGQENSHRLNPSFIEKALFCHQLTELGFSPEMICEAIAIDRSTISRMQKVARSIPEPVIRAIGAAHGIGRRRWEELADLASEHHLDLASIVLDIGDDLENLASDDRFDTMMKAVFRNLSDQVDRPAPTPALPLQAQDGTVLGDMKAGPKALTIRIASTQAPEFARWMQDNAEAQLQRLFEAFKAEQNAE